MSTAAWGQAAAPAQLSNDCQAGGAAIASESPLPNVAAALQNRKAIRILTIGASSVGRRAGSGGYTALIEQLLERAISGLDAVMINRGVSGELAANAQTRIRNEVALTEPDLVLWQVGTNDALAYVSVDEFAATVVETLQWLKEHKIDVVLVGLQFADQMLRDEHYRAIRDKLREIAAKENVIIIRYGEAMQMVSQVASTGTTYTPDEFERTEAGYTCLAQYVARAITLGIYGHGLRPPPDQPAK